MLALLALAGCSLGASPADGLTFKPPAGWSSSPGIMGFMQFWRPPSNDREVLMLFKSPTPLKPSDVFNNSQVNSSLRNIAIERKTAITICGKQPAALFVAHGTSRGGNERVEMVLTNAVGSSYLAMYVRPVQGPSNPSAEAALTELCAKP
jgi:hypothetical protein